MKKETHRFRVVQEGAVFLAVPPRCRAVQWVVHWAVHCHRRITAGFLRPAVKHFISAPARGVACVLLLAGNGAVSQGSTVPTIAQAMQQYQTRTAATTAPPPPRPSAPPSKNHAPKQQNSFWYKIYSFWWTRGVGFFGVLRWAGPFGAR